jgi:periplasmic protein TonB
MEIWFISILLSVSPPAVVPVLFQPVLLQAGPSFKGYGDSPRPGSVSRMHITESVSGKLLIKRAEPEYPADAQAAGVEGDVVFAIVIGKNGKVEEIRLRRGKPVFVEAAARAVSQRAYTPYVFNGGPVEVETFATVRFRLPDKH